MLVFGEGRGSSSFSHPFVIGIIFYGCYSIENTVFIPVNLKVGYESTVLSRGETRQNQSVHF
jgi:hypothetical protein